MDKDINNVYISSAMSEPKQQPKILLRNKPKKSQRPPPGVSQSASASFSKGDGAGEPRNVSTASNAHPPSGPKQPIRSRFRLALTYFLVMNAVAIGYMLFRTSSKPAEILEEVQSLKETAGEEERKAKAVIEEEKTEIGDTRNELPMKEREEGKAREAEEKQIVNTRNELQVEKESEEEKTREADFEEEKRVSVDTQPSKAMQVGVIPQTFIQPAPIQQDSSKRKIWSGDQQELFKWILAEKRKIKPVGKTEKAQLDAEKALLKDFLRGKRVLNV